MNKLFSLLVIMSFVVSVSAQDKISCAPDRYEKDVFSVFNKNTVEYANTKNWKGENVNLLTDIYEPKDDSAPIRPLVIIAHGGSFISGNKEQLAPFATRFVKNGYVVASINYRLIPLEKVREPNAVLRGMVKAINDMKAAIRFFRQSAVNGNPYKIDPNNIFIGGVSAGAITALHVGILDKGDKISDTLTKIIAEEGGFNGDTGSAENHKYSANVNGIFNLSGAVLDENWIDKTDAPVFSYHGMADDVVSIGYRKIGELGLFGSESIKQQADKVGLDNILVKIPGGGHVDVYSLKYGVFFLDYQKQVNQKIRSMLCGESSQKK